MQLVPDCYTLSHIRTLKGVPISCLWGNALQISIIHEATLGQATGNTGYLLWQT